MSPLTVVGGSSSAALGTLPSYPLYGVTLDDRLGVAVNVANGNLIEHSRELTIAGTGLALSIDRYYNNLQSGNGSFGAGALMSTGADVGLTFSGGNVMFTGPSGYKATFTKQAGTSNYTASAGIDASLVYNSGTNTYVVKFNQSEQKLDFNGYGVLTSEVDRNGNTLSFLYNGDGTTSSITDTQGRVTTFTYSSGKLTRITDPSGRYSAYVYNGSGELTQETDPTGAVTKFGYDSSENLTSITDPLNNVTTLGYNSGQQVTSITRPLTASTTTTTSFTYNSGSTVETDGNGHTTTYTISGGLATNVTDGLGHSRAISYTANNDVLTTTDSMSAITTATYDSSNNLSSVKLPTGATTTYGYSSAAHPYAVTQQTDSQGNVLNAAYDTPGNLSSITKAGSSSTFRSYTYNSNGTIHTATDGNGNVTTYGYDTHGNLTSITPPSPLGATTIGYDSLSRVTSVTDGDGNTTTYTYDGDDRVLTEVFAGQSAHPLTNVYDADGNLTSRQSSNSYPTTYTYDLRNELATVTGPPTSQTVTYTHDKVGNLASMTDPNGTTSYTYNAANQLSSMKDPSNATITFTLDSNGRRTGTTWPSGVTQTTVYDAAGRPTSIVYKTSGGTLIDSRAYTYTNSGSSNPNHDTALVQTMTEGSGQVTTYTYDSSNQLTHSISVLNGNTTFDRTWTYDGNGNRITAAPTTYTYNAANELTSDGTNTYTYDADGQPTASDNVGFAYNTAQQTTTITPSGGTAETFTYPGSGQTELRTLGSATVTNTALGVTALTTGSSIKGVIRDDAGGLIEYRSPGGSTYAYMTDQLGTVIGLVDSSGTRDANYTYSSWGATRSSTGTTDALTNPIKYAGGVTDLNSGLIKFGARYYDPNTGRFTQQDPSGQEANAYAYVESDPINDIDPSGYNILDKVVSIAGAVATVAGIAAAFTPPGALVDGLIAVTIVVGEPAAAYGVACSFANCG